MLIKNRLFKSEIVKNSFTLLSAGMLSQIIAIAIYPIVTRQYLPSDLGALSLMLSFIGIGSILATGKYDSVVLLERDDKNASAAFDLMLLINLSFCILLYVLLFFFELNIIRFFHLESILSFLWLIPFLIFLSALGIVATYWFNRQNKFYLSARYSLIQSGSNSALKVLFGFLGLTQWGLIIANFAGQLIGLLSVVFKPIYMRDLFRFNSKRMVDVAKRNVKFPLYTLPHSFINAIAGNLPILILAAWFSMKDVGLFSLGVTIGFRPINVFTASINQVFFQKVSSNLKDGKESFSFLMDFCKKVILFGMPFLLIGFFLIKEITIWIFGKEWADAGVYLQMMMPWFFISIMSSSICFMPSVVGKQRRAMFLEIVYTALRILALFIGVWQNDMKLSVLLFSIVSGLFVAGLLVWFLVLAKKSIK